MREFLRRLLRRIVARSCLPAEWDYDALRSFDFTVGDLLSIPEFMQKSEFRAKVLKVARSKIDVERERGKKSKSDAVAKTVMGESFNPFIDHCRQYMKYVAKELLRHPTFKWDLVIGLACFVYAVLFKLPKTVAVDCYQQLSQRFSSRGWVAERSYWWLCRIYRRREACLSRRIGCWTSCWRHGFLPFLMSRIVTEGVYLGVVQIMLFLLGSCFS